MATTADTTVARWPGCVRDLPVCPRFGLPVPYSSGTAGDGTGRFGRNDPAAKLACALVGSRVTARETVDLGL